MRNIFSESGLSLIYVLVISSLFGLTILTLSDQKIYKKNPRLHYVGLGLLIIWWILALISQTLTTKMYATLMLLSIIIVETAIRRKRKKLP